MLFLLNISVCKRRTIYHWCFLPADWNMWRQVEKFPVTPALTYRRVTNVEESIGLFCIQLDL